MGEGPRYGGRNGFREKLGRAAAAGNNGHEWFYPALHYQGNLLGKLIWSHAISSHSFSGS